MAAKVTAASDKLAELTSTLTQLRSEGHSLDSQLLTAAEQCRFVAAQEEQ